MEVLFLVEERSSSNRRQDANMFKRGDTINAKLDGSPWGRKELSLPCFCIVRISDVPVGEDEILLSPEPVNPDPELFNDFFQPRQVRINIDTLPAYAKDILSGSNKTQVVVDIRLKWSDFSPSKEIKPVRTS